MNVRSMGLFCLLILSNYSFPGATFAKKALHWGIAAGPLWGLAVFRNIIDSDQWRKKIIYPQFKNVSATSQDFIKKELALAGIFNHQNITIKKFPNVEYKIPYYGTYEIKVPYGTITNTIFVGNDTANELDRLLCEQKIRRVAAKVLNTQTYKNLQIPEGIFNVDQLAEIIKDEYHTKLNEHKMTIHHEAGHLERNSLRRISIVSGIIPLITHTFAPRLWALPKLILNCFLLAQSHQHEERQADENVPNKKELLKAAVDFFKPHEKTNKFDWFSSHPHPTKRIARFQERLDLLEKQEQQDRVQETSKQADQC